MEIRYGTNTAYISNFDYFCLSDSIDNSDVFQMTITLPKTPGNLILFQVPYENIEFNLDGNKYLFAILSDGISKTDNAVQIKCVSLLWQSLERYMTSTFNKADINPIEAVKQILTLYSIPFNRYDIEKEIDFFYNLSITMDTVFIYEAGNNIRIMDFLTEILKRIACKLIVDIKNNEVRIHNFILTPHSDEYSDFITIDYIDVKKRKESETKEFYNYFSIGVYPNDYAMMIHEYCYEVQFFEGTDYFNENDLLIEGSLATLRYDKLINGIYYKANESGTLTENKTLYNSGLNQRTIDLGNYSQTVLYGTFNNPLKEIWEDEKANNATSLARHTNMAGAIRLGSLIVEKYYKKRKTLEFTYPFMINLTSGSYMLLEGIRYVLVSQKIQFNRTSVIKLEEIL
jgi:hypothetical protein